MNNRVKAAFEKVGACVPHILLPRKGVEYRKFAVIACDQFSAQPEYWEEVRRYVGESPSALHMMLPEAWLDLQGEATTGRIVSCMNRYLSSGVFEDVGEGLVYVRRNTSGGIRKGLVIALDLDEYDYSKTAKSMIRATEDTVVERLPARIAVREKAPLEMPHVLVLLEDKLGLLDDCLERQREGDEVAYNFDLMQDGGHICGRLINKERDLLDIAAVLEKLRENSGDGFLYAMGDGNHSFAAAKARWEALKPTLTEAQRKNHPARYALCELVNLFDHGLTVEPIHRLLIGVDPQEVQRDLDFDAENPPSLQNLQPRLDAWLAEHPQARLEYIHGAEECRRLGEKPGHLAIVFDGFDRNSLFRVVREKGTFVRKSFSLGSAKEKRYYLECRRIDEA